MEFIVNTAQFEKMIDNRIIGLPKLIDSKINFRGKNNILVCDNNIELNNVILDFNGDNSVIYLSSNLKDSFHLIVYSNSTGYMGRNLDVGSNVLINIIESQNLVIGDDCIIGHNVIISSSQGYSFYNIGNKHRFNFPKSVFIGDHVLIEDNSYIFQGVKIGSGAIISAASVIPPNTKILSNFLVSGNPIRIIKKDVFFTNEFTGHYKVDDTLNSKEYISDVYIYEWINQETLHMDNIDDILNELDVESRLEFIQKLFVENKRKNRFSIV